jgi:hypothetical protein
VKLHPAVLSLYKIGMGVGDDKEPNFADDRDEIDRRFLKFKCLS